MVDCTLRFLLVVHVHRYIDILIQSRAFIFFLTSMPSAAGDKSDPLQYFRGTFGNEMVVCDAEQMDNIAA